MQNNIHSIHISQHTSQKTHKPNIRMCETSERYSTICGHIASHTSLCAQKRPQSIFNILRPKCTPTTERTTYWELCSDCRRFWQKHGIKESDAIERTRTYRVKHGISGSVSPLSHANGDLELMQDINLDSDDTHTAKGNLVVGR